MSRSLCLLLLVGASLHAQEVRREPLVLKQGGTPNQPMVFDGQGMTIDLGIDITHHDWIKEGDIWQSRGPLDGQKPIADEQRAGLFVDEVPIRIARDRRAPSDASQSAPTKPAYLAPSALQPGQMGWREDGSVYFRWPAGKEPGKGRVIQLPEKLQSCVVIACSHLVVRNVTAKYAANDGFNIHGDRTGIRLENVKALSNGDEGISAHETVQMDVVGAEIAWNGSSAGGVADVNDSVTTYTDCVLHHNTNAAFFFGGRKHRVTNCVIYGQEKDIVVRHPDVMLETSGVEWRRP